MKTRTTALITIILLSAVLLSGCMAQPAAGQTVDPAQDVPTSAPAPTATPAPTFAPTATQQPTQDPEQAQAEAAEKAARAYFAAVSAGNSAEAAEQLSSFSLMVFEMTRGDAAAALQTQKIAGVRWEDLEVLGIQSFDAQTMLVQVRYTETNTAADAAPADAPTPTAAPADAAPSDPPAQNLDAVDALWPMRLEHGLWRYNWQNLIDFRTLDARVQTMNGVTIMPVKMNRYSDRVQLSMLVQNRTREAVVFGQVNETLGTFYFGDQPVVAEKTQWILNPLRSVPSAVLETKGLFDQYPDAIEIRKWNNYDVAPWYVFQLQ
jgi:hypothetical protein